MNWSLIRNECVSLWHFVKSLINSYSNYIIKGTRPALTMSVPVRYPAAEDTVEPMDVGEACCSSTIAAESMRERWISIGGRLGTPDAAPIANEWDPKYYVNTQLQHLQQLHLQSHEELFVQLDEALAFEMKYQPSFSLPTTSENGEVSIGARDGAAHVLRCLKVWYDLPTDVLFAATNLVDRLLMKMKVKPKHLACLSVGSFNLAVKQLGLPSINSTDLVTISQCRCSPRDLDRMSDVVLQKLGVQVPSTPVTALTFLRLFFYIFKIFARDAGLSDFYDRFILLQDLEQRLEIMICDANAASIRSCELALVLLCTHLDARITQFMDKTNKKISKLVDYAIELQRACRIQDTTFFSTHSIVVEILCRYNGQHRMPYKQRLVWKLSSRTMKVLRPTDKLTTVLPTISEDMANNNNLRLRTGSTSSEEGEDWPTSPVVPVCEQC